MITAHPYGSLSWVPNTIQPMIDASLHDVSCRVQVTEVLFLYKFSPENALRRSRVHRNPYMIGQQAYVVCLVETEIDEKAYTGVAWFDLRSTDIMIECQTTVAFQRFYDTNVSESPENSKKN